MNLFESPRKVEQEPKFQFHFELTSEEVRRIQSELRNYALPGTSGTVLRMLTRSIDARRRN